MNDNDVVRGQPERPALDPRVPKLSLRRAIAIFARQKTAHALVLAAAAAWGVRLMLGDFTWVDAALAAGLIAVHPLTEWLIHVVFLHWRPRVLWGHTFDFRIARAHRSHHQDPDDPKFWFMPLRSAFLGFALLMLLAALLLPTKALVFTVMGTGFLVGLVYEWTHYLTHCSYRPRSRWYRRIWRFHRLHHFKNERYWMGVTLHAADRLLGTCPDPREVETSPNCRSLFGG